MAESNIYDVADRISNDEQIVKFIHLFHEIVEKYGDEAEMVRQYLIVTIAPSVDNSYELLGFLDFFKHNLMKLMVRDPDNPFMILLNKGKLPDDFEDR